MTALPQGEWVHGERPGTRSEPAEANQSLDAQFDRADQPRDDVVILDDRDFDFIVEI